MNKEFMDTAHLFSLGAPYIESLYDDYLRDPDLVSEEWRACFEQLGSEPSRRAPRPQPTENTTVAVPRPAPVRHETQVAPPSGTGDAIPAEKQSGVRELIMSYRIHGHMAAKLDPIQIRAQEEPAALTLEEHNLSDDDLGTVFDCGTMWGPTEAPLRDIIQVLKQTYTRSIGVEYNHINNLEQRNWIRDRLERTRASSSHPPDVRKELLGRITAAEGMERFLHTRYSGQKRFSLEGAGSLIPMLDTLIERCGGNGVKEIAIGMAHRGRLNVLVNIMGKTAKDLFLQFENKYEAAGKGSGDVKYHEGYSTNVRTAGGPLHLALAFNPSHLEIINPVVEGSVRARQDRRKDYEREKVIPILIHGDAAITGQGVVYETFNLAQTRGFTTGGTIHIVVNNQIGFTLSNPLDSRSTRYCTDIGKVVQAPILHVNGDDPEAVVYAAQLAIDWRIRYHKDVLIDLVCYRRHGHNEADEPAATQPMMYQKIRDHKSTRELYADQLIREGIVTDEEVRAMAHDYRARLEAGENVAPNIDDTVNYPHIADWSDYIHGTWDSACDTRLKSEDVKRLGNLITTIPEDFQLHPRVRKLMDDRVKMIAGALPMDWGCAETLAYASLLESGAPIRLTGQDSGRGTFFHRHAVLHNQRNGDTYIPLRNLGENQGEFTVVDSILSEEAVLGFEYGYSTTDPEALVVWEAQFGDFVNGAQVVIDQFLCSSEQKWRRLCGLVLLLPHGWEGQGPEHSSARLERFLQLSAEDNIQVATPTTPAQIFHLLRRELIRRYRKPLVIMSPKSTLRRKRSFSSLEDLTSAGFQLIIEDTTVDPAVTERVLLCSGKVYYDILEEREKREIENIAIVRVEQLYPFPRGRLGEVLTGYGRTTDIIWVQEEPRNQGAWYSIQHKVRHCLQPGQQARCVSRAASAAPAGGDIRKHTERQGRILDDALTLGRVANVRILPNRSETIIAK
jgi:2-oxoglutarate dehydrogenase E1 component